MSEDIKPAENPLIFHDMGSDANGPPAASPLPCPESSIVTPGRKRPKLVTTLTLTSDNCRWPFGDPTKSGFHYCGRMPQTGRPYCDTHDRMSYQSSPRRKPS
jgi:GcrA cell cycle regulator